MPVPTPVFPDIEHLVVTFLTDAEMVPPRVLTKLPLPLVPPVVRVTRTSGANRSIYIDRPIIDVDIFHDDYAAASALSRVIQNLLLMTLRATTTPDGTVQEVTTVIGPRWMPDPNPALVRYGASYEVHVRT
jgi:hypothetical protein